MAPKNKTVIEDDEDQLAFINEASEADNFDDEESMEISPPVPSLPEAGNDQPAAKNADDDDKDDLLDSDALKAGTPDPDAAPVTPEAAPATSEVPASTPEATQTPGQVEQTPTPAVAETPAQPAAVSDAPPSPDQMVGIYNDWRRESEDLLANHHYTLSHEQAEELELEPHKAIPKLMAKVYLDAVSAAIGQITTHLPRMVRLVSEQEQANQATEQTFWEKWPDLKDAKDTVVQIGQAYRANNPTASAQDFINNVGAMAMVALKKPIAGSSQPQAPTPQPNAPFVPAAQTPVGGTSQKAPVGNIFTQLDADMFEEEL